MLNGIDDDAAWDIAVALSACASAGTLRWAVDAVTSHLRTREQFGKLIGTFQALQHEAAMLLVNSELATASAWDAVRAVDEAPEQRQLAGRGCGRHGCRTGPRTVARCADDVRRHRVHMGTRRPPVLATRHQSGRVDGADHRLVATTG